MKKKIWIKSWVFVGWVITSALLLTLLPIQIQAQDVDNDGFDELGPLTLIDGTNIPICLANTPSPGDARNACLDPNTKDLFVILVPGTDPSVGGNHSYIPDDPLRFIYRSKNDGGLEIATHRITLLQADLNRYVTPNQKAIKITESPDTLSGTDLGISNHGTPNGMDLATIFTDRIRNTVNNICYGKASCTNFYDQASGIDNVVKTYIRQTIAHEAAHMMNRTSTYDRRIGWHYATGTGVVLDQSVKYTSKGGNVTFYIPVAFTDVDRQGATLK